MALVVEKLIKYLWRWHSPEVVAKVANLVNEHFPDAKGFIDETLHESRFAFKSEGSAYYCVPETCKVYYNRKKSEALNPKFVFSGHTREVDFSQKMRSTLLIYRQPKSKKEADDWRKKAAENKKARLENEDELLLATRIGSRNIVDSSSGGGSGSPDESPRDSYEITAEEPKQPEEYEQPAIKIETLDDVKKLNLERKPKKAKKAKKPPKKKKEPATKGIW